MKPNIEQEEALELITQWASPSNKQKEFILYGRAGTGKTTTTRWSNLEEASNREHVVGVAMAHKATSVLRQQLNLPCQTLASLIGRQKVYDLDTGMEDFLIQDNKPNHIEGLLVVDEASMISTEDHRDIDLLYPDCKVLYLGDPYQLPPIKGTSLLLTKNGFPSYTLTINQRTGNESPLINEFNKIIDAIIATESTGKKSWYTPTVSEKLSLNGRQEDFWTDDTRIITYTNPRRKKLNETVRNMYGYKEEYVIGDLMIFQETLTIEDPDDYFNSKPRKQFYNGTTFYIENLAPSQVRYDGETFSSYETVIGGESIQLPTSESKKRVAKLVKHYQDLGKAEKNRSKRKQYFRKYFDYKELFPDIDYGYCITSHKAQGSTFERVIVDGKNIKASTHFAGHANMLRSLYVALSRTKDKVNVIW